MDDILLAEIPEISSNRQNTIRDVRKVVMIYFIIVITRQLNRDLIPVDHVRVAWMKQRSKDKSSRTIRQSRGESIEAGRERAKSLGLPDTNESD